MTAHCNIILFFLFGLLVSCNGQETKNNIQVSNENKKEIMNPKIKNVLELELSKGFATSNSQGESPNFEIDENYFLLTTPILNDSLLKNGYKITETRFKEKIKDIFGLEMLNEKILHINLYNKCKNDSYPYSTWEGGDIYNNHLLNEYYFLTRTYHLPEIIDYKKIYSLQETEDTIRTRYPDDYDENEEIIITRWKDIPDLDKQRKFNIDLLVNRNLYLFNDDKSRLMWLLANDSYFMESLVLTFGWTKDEKLLKWVIENNRFDKNDPQIYGSLFWTKQCDGKVKLHSDTFKLLQKLYLPNDRSENRYILHNIKDYIEYLGDKEQSKYENLSAVDRVKILANMAYFAEQYRYDEDYNNYLRMMGRLRIFLSESDREILKDNNYFGLPKFKEWWDNADYDEYYLFECEYGGGVCGRDNQPLDYSEWRKQNPK